MKYIKKRKDTFILRKKVYLFDLYLSKLHEKYLIKKKKK